MDSCLQNEVGLFGLNVIPGGVSRQQQQLQNLHVLKQSTKNKLIQLPDVQSGMSAGDTLTDVDKQPSWGFHRFYNKSKHFQIRHMFAAACGALTSLSESGTRVWLRVCAFILPTEGCAVRPRPSPRGTACQPACARSQLPSPYRSSECEGKKKTTEDQTTADVSERFVMMWISKRSSHRLVLQVLWRVFKMWPKIDRHLKRDGVEVNLTEGKTNRKQENHQHNPCVTDRAALVEWDGGEVEAFKQVFISNTLAHSVFKEYHLKNRICRLTAANRGRFSERILFLETCPHPAWARRLQAFLRFVHVVLLLKVQVTLELD